ncbi:MAG TPA: rod shape-determining protein MreD [Thermodesulfovibrionales bacterium]|nr:rod shape-determining protein MreD [Thermodesulfovibrionales bacterium]
MRLVGLLFGVALALVLQMKVSVFGVSPDLTAVVAYYFGIKEGATRGIFFGSLIGIIEDSVSGVVLGPNLLGKALVGFFSSFMSGTLFRWTPLLGMVSIFVLTVLDGIVVVLSRTIFESVLFSPSRLGFVLFGQAVLNLSLGVFIRPRNVD